MTWTMYTHCLRHCAIVRTKKNYLCIANLFLVFALEIVVHRSVDSLLNLNNFQHKWPNTFSVRHSSLPSDWAFCLFDCLSRRTYENTFTFTMATGGELKFFTIFQLNLSFLNILHFKFTFVAFEHCFSMQISLWILHFLFWDTVRPYQFMSTHTHTQINRKSSSLWRWQCRKKKPEMTIKIKNNHFH